MVNFCLQSYTFLPLVYHMCGSGSVFGMRIRIHKVTKVLNTDPIWIRIDNTDLYQKSWFWVPIVLVFSLILTFWRV